MKNLIVLVADKNIEFTIRSILLRSKALNIHLNDDSFDIFVHPFRDPGCLNVAHDLLRGYISEYKKALVVFDYEGCGRKGKGVEDIRNQVKHNLALSGWSNNAEVIVINPELEIWVWSDSSEVDNCLGWSGKMPDLRNWLKHKGLLREGELKPEDPKLALDEALREVNKPRSSSIFSQLAEKVSFRRCNDPSFTMLKVILQEWFGSIA